MSMDYLKTAVLNEANINRLLSSAFSFHVDDCKTPRGFIYK